MTPTQGQARRHREFIAVGRVVRPHGVRGALLVEPYSPVIESLRSSNMVYLGAERTPLKVEYLRPHANRYLLGVAQIESREQADAYRNEDVLLRLEHAPPLPEGTYYHWELLGIQVHTIAGEHLGQLDRILETGANDVYVVSGDQGEELLIPAIASVIREVDLERGRMLVELPPGLRPVED